jgi:hypothetical protein
MAAVELAPLRPAASVPQTVATGRWLPPPSRLTGILHSPSDSRHRAFGRGFRGVPAAPRLQVRCRRRSPRSRRRCSESASNAGRSSRARAPAARSTPTVGAQARRGNGARRGSASSPGMATAAPSTSGRVSAARGRGCSRVHHIYGGDALVVADDQLRTVCRKHNPAWRLGAAVTR